MLKLSELITSSARYQNSGHEISSERLYFNIDVSSGAMAHLVHFDDETLSKKGISSSLQPSCGFIEGVTEGKGQISGCICLIRNFYQLALSISPNHIIKKKRNLIKTHSLQRSQCRHLLTTPAPAHCWLPTNFQNFVNPFPHPNFAAFQLFSNCIQIHYFNLYKTLLWSSNKGYRGVVVLSIKQDYISQVVLNAIPFYKRKL